MPSMKTEIEQLKLRVLKLEEQMARKKPGPKSKKEMIVEDLFDELLPCSRARFYRLARERGISSATVDRARRKKNVILQEDGLLLDFG